MANWKVSGSTTAALTAAGLAGSAALMWANSDPEGYVFDPSHLDSQSIAHPEIVACRLSKHADCAAEETSITIYDAFISAVQLHGDAPYLGWRSSNQTGYDNWLTYSQTLERVTNIGYGLRWLDQQPSNDTLIGMFSKNRVEMLMTQLACYQHSMVIVPMYDTLGDEGIQHIVNQTGMQLVICDDENKVKHLLAWGKDKLPSIKTLVHMEPVGGETVMAVRDQGWEIFSFSDVENYGASNPVPHILCGPDDLCVICYTSGTTGKPKGAMIQHNPLYRTAKNALAVTTRALGDSFIKNEVYLSYLPIAHVYEQINIVEMTILGSKIGFHSGDVAELLNDITYLRPTVFASVPRLLTKIHDMVMNAANQSSVKRWLFAKAFQEKEEYYKRGIITKSTIWDKILFKNVREMLGGRVKIMVTGAAPISPPVLRFFRLAFGAVIYEGYGQTESSAAMSLTLVGEYHTGEVGPPLSCNMIKLVDVPEMNYYATDNVGEICVHGMNVFKGYLHDEEKTKETIDSEGWLHTGDIGTWTERGTLRIIDRKKNIFKLSQGEYIAPEKIENVYVNCSLVAQCFVHGDSLQSSLLGVVVPDADVLPNFAKSKLGLDITDIAELCRNDKVKAAVLDGMAKSAQIFNLKGFEQVKDIYLTADVFSVENGLLTPTLKLKRIECRRKYQEIINRMYDDLERSSTAVRSSL